MLIILSSSLYFIAGHDFLIMYTYNGPLKNTLLGVFPGSVHVKRLFLIPIQHLDHQYIWQVSKGHDRQ